MSQKSFKDFDDLPLTPTGLGQKEQIIADYKDRRNRRPGVTFSEGEWLNLFKHPSPVGGDFSKKRRYLSCPIKKGLSLVRNQKILTAFKERLVLEPDLKEIVVGSLLGDLGMQRSGRNWRIKLCQGNRLHRAYLWHLFDKLYYFSLSSPQPYLRKSGLAWQWDSIAHPAFSELHEEWFVLDPMGSGGFKKTVPTNFESNYLTDRTLAYWYMDDGYILDPRGIGKALAFATHGFKPKEVAILCQALRSKYGWKVWAKKNKGKEVVVISGDNFEDVLSKIGPYIHPSMLYKVPLPRKKRSKNGQVLN